MRAGDCVFVSYDARQINHGSATCIFMNLAYLVLLLTVQLY